MSTLEPLMSSENEHWNTPDEVLSVIRRFGPIGLDPCSNEGSRVGARVNLLLTNGQNGLDENWVDLTDPAETIFVNPPYGKEQIPFVHKCLTSGYSRPVFLLVPARPDTKIWQEVILPHADICFIKGRLKFVGAPNPAPFPSALALFGSRWHNRNVKYMLSTLGHVVLQGLEE